MKNIFIVALSLALSLIATESGLRLFYKSTPTKSYACNDGGHPAYNRTQCPTSQDRMNAMQFSGDLLYTPIPDSKGKGWSTDSHGFRRNEPAEKAKIPSQKQIRISVTGGSTAWGVGVADAQTFPAQLQALLTQKCQGIDVVVWNGAISAQTSGQERRRFETDILPLKPDIHVAFSGFNDIYNSYAGLLPHQNRDYFEVRKRFGAAGAEDFLPIPPKLEDSTLRMVHLAKVAYFNWTYDPKKLSLAIERRVLSTDETIRSALRTVHLFSSWANEYRYEFHYAQQPSIYSTQKPLTADEVKLRDSDAEFGNFHHKGYEQLKLALKKAQKNGLRYIDMDESIRNERKDLFIDNVHFGDRGYAMLAASMVDYLVRSSPTIQKNCKALN